MLHRTGLAPRHRGIDEGQPTFAGGRGERELLKVALRAPLARGLPQLAAIVGDVTVTDTTGAAVDTSEFFGPDDAEGAADES